MAIIVKKIAKFFNTLCRIRNKIFWRGKKGADNKGAGKKDEEQKGRRAKKAQNKKGAEQKGREITILRHRYIQGRNFFR